MKPNGLKRFVFLVLAGLLAFSTGLPPGLVAASPAASPDSQPLPPRMPQELPPEVLDAFQNMHVTDLLAQHEGPIPRALQSFVDEQVTVVLEMEDLPLAAYLVETVGAAGVMEANAQQAYVQNLENAHIPVVSALEAMGGTILGRYSRAFNGVMVLIPLGALPEAANLPGVTGVYKVPTYTIDLAQSINLMDVDEVWANYDYRGEGIQIAIIDTGIDYTHAAFGGPGTAQAYEDNDPNVIEPGTFPTAKVVGGYDFAGTNYNASDRVNLANRIPQPDPDPLDENGHGTHVASIAAGMAVTSTAVYSGVAPMAELYALKVFGVAGSTDLTLNAIEWALDPNQDAIINDRVDVINMSLGSDFGPSEGTAEMLAVQYASALGVVVVAASGNAGDTPFITSSPASANSAISVAASTTGWLTGPTVGISETTVLTLTGIVYRPSGFDSGGRFTEEVSGPLFDVGTVITDTLCTTAGLAPNVLSGAVALIQRGACNFDVKVNNAASLGAVAAIIYNHAAGGNALINMGGGPVPIPAGFIGYDYGVYLRTAHGEIAVVSEEHDVITIEDPVFGPDELSSFTARGPRGFDGFVKPELTAPGVGIFAAEAGTGVFGTPLNGTSMATPLVAGVAALVRQAHPNWTAEQVKAAMMNTAVDVHEGSIVPLMGAGRVDALGAVETTSIAVGDSQLVSLNWGILEIGTDVFSATDKRITLTNFSGSGKTYNVTTFYGTESLTQSVDISVPVSSVSVPGNGSASVEVEIDIDVPGLTNEFGLLEQYYGFVVFTNAADADDVLRVPFSVIPRPYSQIVVTSVMTSTVGISATIDITHTGPIASSLSVWPLVESDPNEVTQGDEGDLRLIGMDYLGVVGTRGPVFGVALNTWGAWHTPQAYFAEFDMYLDVDQDGEWDLANFNYNLGAFSGLDDNDTWVVVQVDLETGDLALASPFLIYADYVSGYMEWYLPAAWNGLTPGTDEDFDYQFISYDYDGNQDVTDPGYFDYTLTPLSIDISGNPGPLNPNAQVNVTVVNLAHYRMLGLEGVMIVDENGLPGAGQAVPVYLNFDELIIDYWLYHPLIYAD